MLIRFFAFWIVAMHFVIFPLESYALDVRKIDLDTFKQVMSSEEDIKFVFVFTSWCGVCKAMFNEIADLYTQYKEENRVKIIMLSIDDNSGNFAAFTKQYAANNAVVYSTLGLTREEILNMLRSNRIGFKGKIPHMTIFHKNSVVGDDIYEIQSVHKLIEYVLSQN